MIGKKIGALTLTATMLLTACGQSTDSLESFYKKIEKANKRTGKTVLLFVVHHV